MDGISSLQCDTQTMSRIRGGVYFPFVYNLEEESDVAQQQQQKGYC